MDLRHHLAVDRRCHADDPGCGVAELGDGRGRIDDPILGAGADVLANRRRAPARMADPAMRVVVDYHHYWSIAGGSARVSGGDFDVWQASDTARVAKMAALRVMWCGSAPRRLLEAAFVLRGRVLSTPGHDIEVRLLR